MRLIRNNGEHWYVDDRPVWRRVLTWVLWPGGWNVKDGSPLRERLRPRNQTPLSLLGHRVTFYGWGAQARWRDRGYWTWVRYPMREAGVYYRPNDATEPTIYWRGAPAEAVRAAVEHAEWSRNREREWAS